MKLTKQRKVYAAFLGLAAAAFVADRVFFLPAGAGAATMPEASGASEKEGLPASTGGAAPGAAQAGASGPTLAEKLAAVAAEGGGSRNPFQPLWRGAGAGGPAVPEGKASAEAGTAAEFSVRHELRAVSRVNDTAVAVIGKVARRVGDVVDGWTVVSIEDRSATLERAGQRVTLVLRGTMPDNAIVQRRTGQAGPDSPDRDAGR